MVVDPYDSTRWWVVRLFDRRELLLTLVWRELKIRYKQSVMGALWALLMPMMIVAAGVLVRTGFAMASGGEVAWADAMSVAVRGVPWAFFVAAIRFSSVSLITNTNLVTKIYLPREAFPVASVLAQFVDFLVASAVLAVFLVATGIGVGVVWLWLPLLLGQLVLITIGFGMLLSAGCLFFRDVKYLVEVILTFAIFFTPVFYEASFFGHWSHLLLLNPVAPILEGIGSVVMQGVAPDPAWTAYSGAWALGLLFLGGAVFRRTEPYFAESV